MAGNPGDSPEVCVYVRRVSNGCALASGGTTAVARASSPPPPPSSLSSWSRFGYFVDNGTVAGRVCAICLVSLHNATGAAVAAGPLRHWSRLRDTFGRGLSPDAVGVTKVLRSSRASFTAIYKYREDSRRKALGSVAAGAVVGRYLRQVSGALDQLGILAAR